MPVLAADAARLAEAQRCRPGARALKPGARERLAVLRATVAGALERSLDVAAVLEMRGYPPARRSHRTLGARSRHDLAFAASAAAIALLALGCSLSGVAPFSPYPLVHVPFDPAVLVLALALPAVALAPFLDRAGIEP